MKNKNFVILVIVLALLVVIFAVQQLSHDKKTVKESLIQLFPDFNKSSVAYIDVYKLEYPDSGLTFAKKDGNWIVTSYFDAPGKETEIDKLLDDINLLQGEVRATRPDLFNDFDISDSLALHIVFLSSDSTEILHLLVGKGVAGAARSSFVRKDGDDLVYKASENFLSRFAVWNAEPAKRMPGKRWADLKLTDLDKDDITAFGLKVGNKQYEFSKKEQASEDTTAPPTYVWQQDEPKKGKVLEDKDIKPIVNRLARLTASDIVGREVMPEYGLTKPKYKADITAGNNQQVNVFFGNEADTTSNARYVMVEGKPVIYEAAKYNFEALFVNPFKDSK